MATTNPGLSPNYNFLIRSPYQAIRENIETNQKARFAYDRTYLKNEIAAQLTNTVEIDINRLQKEQMAIKAQLAQIQARLNMVG